MIDTLYKYFISLILLCSISMQLGAMRQFEQTLGTTKIILIEDDLFNQPVTAIVNAANTSLLGGGGIDGLFHDKAGQKLKIECSKFPIIRSNIRCEVGDAKITGAHDLATKGFINIIHTVGPLGTDVDREKKLHDAYTNSLTLAQQHGHTTIAFPAISATLYYYDVHYSAPVALKAIQEFVTNNPNAFKEIRLAVLSTNKSETGHPFFDEYQAAMTGTTLAPLPKQTKNSELRVTPLFTKKIVLGMILIMLGCYGIHKWFQCPPDKEAKQDRART